MGIARILPSYPCFILVWQDYSLCVVVFVCYVVRTLVMHFKYEWVHERLKYFQREKEIMNGVETKPLRTWYHEHRHWMDKSFLMKVVGAIIVSLAVFPSYASIRAAKLFRTIETNQICDENGWGEFFAVCIVIQVVILAILAIKVRKAQDIYNCRRELKYGALTIAVVFVMYTSASFTNQYGISTRFPISTLFAGGCGLVLSYIVGWLPVRDIPKIDHLLRGSKVYGSSKQQQLKLQRDADSSSKEEPSKTMGVMGSAMFNRFSSFISTSVARGEFERFLLKAYAIENLCFFDAMVQYNQTAFAENVERNKLLVDALRVYDEFIREGAVLNVNISHESKAKFDVIFQAALEQGALQSHDVLNSEQFKEFSVSELQTLYEGAFKEILSLLVEDLLRKFRNTPEYDAISLELLQNSFRTSSQGPNSSVDTQPIPMV
jgi:hypothetical protein